MNFFKKAFMGVSIFAAGTGTLLAASSSENNVAVGVAVVAGLIGALIGLIFSLVFIIATWKVFTKAGQPGWAAIVPIYNMIVLWQISRQPVWALVFCFLPFLNIVGTIMISLGVAKSFGKGGGFGIGLWLFSIIFYPILGFGSSEYQDS